MENTNTNKHSTYFLNIYSCTFDIGYGRNNIGFAFYFNLNYTTSVLQVPSVPLNNYLNICNNFINSLCCVNVKCWHWVSIILCKYAFSYLAYNITRNNFVAVRTCYDSYTSLTQASVNDSSGVIFLVLKYLNIYVTKSIMGVVDPFKCPSSASITC